MPQNFILFVNTISLSPPGPSKSPPGNHQPPSSNNPHATQTSPSSVPPPPTANKVNILATLRRPPNHHPPYSTTTTTIYCFSKYSLKMQKFHRFRIFPLIPSLSLHLHPSKVPSPSLYSTCSLPSRIFSNLLHLPSSYSFLPSKTSSNLLQPSRGFSSISDSEIPAPIDYRSVLQEGEFHRLADSTIHHLLEKLEEYGDTIEIDGFDVDYGNEVLTLKLGDLGTYVVNKQTPNRQIWLSSPVSGPSRYDWDPSAQAWVYRRNKETLLDCLEKELEQLCGQSLSLS